MSPLVPKRTAINQELVVLQFEIAKLTSAANALREGALDAGKWSRLLELDSYVKGLQAAGALVDLIVSKITAILTEVDFIGLDPSPQDEPGET